MATSVELRVRGSRRRPRCHFNQLQVVFTRAEAGNSLNHFLRHSKELDSIQKGIHPASRNAIARHVSAHVVHPVVSTRENQSEILQYAYAERREIEVRPLVNLIGHEHKKRQAERKQ